MILKEMQNTLESLGNYRFPELMFLHSLRASVYVGQGAVSSLNDSEGFNF